MSLSSNVSRVFPGLDPKKFKKEWFGTPRADALAAVAVALALIPEAIAFSLIAGVDPKVGLYASFTMAVVASLFGGRSGMISGATGAMALLMVPLVATHGIEYLFAASVLTGVFQVVFRMLRLSRYMRYVPRSVMTGFVNALAILIFTAQLPHFVGVGPTMYLLVGAGLAIIYLLPRLTRTIPAPLVAIVALTALTIGTGLPMHTVGDMGELPRTLPHFHLPLVPLSMDTLRIIGPFAIAMAMVGIIESLLTAAVVDEMTDTPSCKHSESYGQGLANIVTGCFGGMAGCAMIGQSVINVKSGGRGRLSTLLSGVFLLFFVVVLGDWVARIPTAALVAVMITVAVGTFDWKSIASLRTMPVSESLVMLVTVGTVVITHDLSVGVLIGVVMSAVLFARKVGKLVSVERTFTFEGRRVYIVRGELFFVSVEAFIGSIDFNEAISDVEIDLSRAHVWDASAVAAIDRVVLKLRGRGMTVHVTGADTQSAALLDRIAVHDRRPGAAHAVAGH